MRTIDLAEFIYHNITVPEYPNVIRVKFGQYIPVSIWTALKTKRWSSLVRVTKINQRYLFSSNKSPVYNDNNNLEDNQMATNKNQGSDNNDPEKDFYDSLRSCFTGDKFSDVADSIKITAVQGVVLASYLKSKDEMGFDIDKELKDYAIYVMKNQISFFPMIEIKGLMDKGMLTEQEIKDIMWECFTEAFLDKNNVAFDESELHG